jgi:hypothetical protein
MRHFILLSALLLTTVLSPAQDWKPQDISGLYSFVRNGETVQVNVQPDGRVSGYISRMADGESDRGQLLDVMFDKASLQGERLEFHTKKIHGEWFEFKGIVERGAAKTHDEEGYFVLRGTLTTMKEDVNGKPMPIASEVAFKSFPGGM